MNVAAVTVLYDTPSEYTEKLQSDLHTAGIQNVFFVDNTGTNKGYAEGLNSVLKKRMNKHDLFIVCNPDISVEGITKQVLSEGADHFDVWGYAMNQDGTVYYGGEIEPLRMSGGMITLEPKNRFSRVDFVSGSFMVIKAQVFQRIGLFDESYGMYYEDVDFCYRAKKAGFTVGIDKAVVYEHFEESKKNDRKQKWLAKSRLRFMLKHGSLKQKLYEFIRLPKTLLEDGKHFFS